MNRRSFLKTAAAAASTTIPAFGLGKAGPSANSKVNVALIGTGNIARLAYEGAKDENLVALCDVDPGMFGKYAEGYPAIEKAKTFTDFRVMLDKMGKETDMVCVNTPDHTHFVATLAAMERGIHVFTQKPLVHNVWQARTLRRAKDRYKVHTNMGNQGHTYNGIRQLKEWYDHGVFGQITKVHSFMKGPDWGNRFFKKPKSLPLKESPVPQGLHWDLWQGPTGPAPYHKLYHPMTWRGFNRYGTGQFGDWFCHIADAPVWLLDLYDPVRIEAEWVAGGDDVMAVDGCRIRFDFERRRDKAPCTFYWHNGVGDAYRPSLPEDWSWPESVVANGGNFYYGTKSNAYTAGLHHSLRLTNMDKMRELKASGYPARVIPRIEGGPVKELVDTIKGVHKECGANFDYAAPLTEVMLLGLIAANHGGKIEWDSKNTRITNRPELNQYLKEPVRKGWEYGAELWE